MLENLKPFYNSVLRPIARGLMVLHIQPNHITLFGTSLFAVAGYYASAGKWHASLLIVIAGSLMDGLDGLLARESGKKTVFGAILDSSCDRLTEMFLIFGVMVYYLEKMHSEAGVYLSFGAVCGSVLVSYVKARCEGVQVPCRGGILQRPERIIILCAGLLAGPVPMMWILAGLTLFASATFLERLFIAWHYCKKYPQ